MPNYESSVEQGRNSAPPEPTQPAPRPYLRLVTACDLISPKFSDSAVHGGPKELRPARETMSQGLLDRYVQAQIGRMLREVFSDLAEEPIPERFVRWLEALEAQE